MNRAPLHVISSAKFRLHAPACYPESPARLDWAWRGIADALQAAGFTAGDEAPDFTPGRGLGPLYDEQLRLVHTAAYLSRLDAACASGAGSFSIDTEISEESGRVARLAAAAACQAADLAADTGMPAVALVRPPGHHASGTVGTGFCLINNVAVAARHIQSRQGGRVAIVDWDVHHGNGTQDIFYNDPSVLYLSLHEFPAYPLTGWVTECGAGAGEGATVNVPLPSSLVDDQAVVAFRRVILPVLRSYRPDALLVSAGQDGHWLDPMGAWRLTAAGYYGMARDLMLFTAETGCAPPVIVLEGGYTEAGMRTSMAGIAFALLGHDLAAPATGDAGDGRAMTSHQKAAYERRIDEVVKTQRQYWALP